MEVREKPYQVKRTFTQLQKLLIDYINADEIKNNPNR